VPRLSDWNELPVAGVADPATAPHVRTGSWRTGVRPELDVHACVQCLLCWLYCPDSAVRIAGSVVLGFDHDVCKGCELCAAVCPVDAIAMVPDA